MADRIIPKLRANEERFNQTFKKEVLKYNTFRDLHTLSGLF